MNSKRFHVELPANELTNGTKKGTIKNDGKGPFAFFFF